MLDEPASGLSPQATGALAEALAALRERTTVLLIEHNVRLVFDLCDEVYVLSAGRMLAHGPADTLVERPDVVAAYLGEAVHRP